MRFLVLILLASCAAPRVAVQSVCAEYARYARGSDTSRAVFDRDVGAKFPPFYKYRFDRFVQSGKAPEKELAEYVEEFPKIAAAYDRHCSTMSATVSTQVEKFTKIFPDFDESVAVTVLHSLGEMDGGIRSLDGKSYFIIGIDGIARYHPEGDQTAFFHHELFHLYQEKRTDVSTDELWGSLWVEGLAVHASHVLNPTALPKDLLLDFPEGAYTACIEKLPALAAALRPILRSKDDKTASTWFMMSAEAGDVPKRAGYCVGEKVAARIAGEIGLSAAARLNGEALVSQIDAALAALSDKVDEATRAAAPGADTSSKAGHTEPTE